MLLVVALGGALGALARYAVEGWVYGAAGAGFPWGTLAVNLSGCALLGFLASLLAGLALPPEWRAFLAVGFCGAYTTFSTFTYETVRLLEGGAWLRAAAYVAASVAGGLAATLLGFGLAAAVLNGRGA